MEHPQNLPRVGKVSLIYGLIFGLIIGIIDIIYSYVLDATNLPFVQALYQAFASLPYTLSSTIVAIILSLPIYFLLLLAFFLVGIFASNKAKKVNAGLLAALWTGVVFVAMDFLVATILLFYLVVVPLYKNTPGMSAADLANLINSSLIFNISYSLTAGLILIVLGLGIGALGGLLGASIGKPAQPYQTPSPNLYQPYQSYPPYQAQPYANPEQSPYYQGLPPAQMPLNQSQPYANPEQSPYEQSPYGQESQPEQMPPPPQT